MRKVKQYMGFIIAKDTKNDTEDGSGWWYHVFQPCEYKLGEGLRDAEWQADTIEECIDWIDSY